MASDAARIALAGVGFAYGERRVLDGVALDAHPGEVVGLIGPNGSGKSTLIRLISGVLRGYTGSIRLDGAEVSDLPARELARRLAVVPQEPSFGFPFTALEIVLMGRHPHRAGLSFESTRDIAVARTTLDRCGAGRFAGRSIHALSSGERQRVVFAKALAQEAATLLLDEPASFLDIRHQVELYEIVRELAAEGRAVLTVLHDLNLAAEYCDRVYLLRGGRVVAGGATDDVFTYTNLRRTFDTDLYVDRNHLTGRLLVVPLSVRARKALERDPSGRPGG